MEETEDAAHQRQVRWNVVREILKSNCGFGLEDVVPLADEVVRYIDSGRVDATPGDQPDAASSN